MWKGRLAIISLLVVSLLSGLSMLTVGGASDDQLEVYSWWTGPGEEEGLAAMAEAFEAANPGIRFVNAAVSGGAGSNAKAILASRLLANDPPDSYQRHAGLELLDDVRSGKVQDLTSLYEEQGWRNVFPKGLLDNLTIDGKIYAVPVNIHRANLIWFNPRTLKELGIAGPPKTWAEFLTQAAVIRGKGKVPLAVGPEWTQKHLMETVLLGELGADSYERLFSGDLRLDLARGHVGAGHVRQGARRLRREVRRGGVAAAARPDRRGFRRVRGDGRLELLLPGTGQEAAVARRVRRRHVPGHRRRLRLPVRLLHPADRRAPARTCPASGSSSAAPRPDRTSSTRSRAPSRPEPTQKPTSTRDISAGRCSSGAIPRPVSSAPSRTAWWPTTPTTPRSTRRSGCSSSTATSASSPAPCSSSSRRPDERPSPRAAALQRPAGRPVHAAPDPPPQAPRPGVAGRVPAGVAVADPHRRLRLRLPRLERPGLASPTGVACRPTYHFVGLDNYVRLMRDERWHADMRNLVIFTGVFVVGALVLGFLMAMLLDKGVRGEGFLRGVFLFPMAISFIATAIVWRWLLDNGSGDNTAGHQQALRRRRPRLPAQRLAQVRLDLGHRRRRAAGRLGALRVRDGAVPGRHARRPGSPARVRPHRRRQRDAGLLARRPPRPPPRHLQRDRSS